MPGLKEIGPTFFHLSAATNTYYKYAPWIFDAVVVEVVENSPTVENRTKQLLTGNEKVLILYS